MKTRLIILTVLAASTASCRQAPTSQPAAIPPPIPAATAPQPQDSQDLNAALLEQADRIRRFASVIVENQDVPIDNYDAALLTEIKQAAADLKGRATPVIRESLAFKCLSDAAVECDLMATTIADAVASGGIASMKEATRERIEKAYQGKDLDPKEKGRIDRLERLVDHASKAGKLTTRFRELRGEPTAP